MEQNRNYKLKDHYEIRDLGLVYRTFKELFNRRPPKTFIDFRLSFLVFHKPTIDIFGFEDWLYEKYSEDTEMIDNTSIRAYVEYKFGNEAAEFIQRLL